MAFVIAEKAPFGVYHLSNENSCSWYQFAKEILKDTEVEVLPGGFNSISTKGAKTTIFCHGFK